jgi:hypothetical protein
VGRRCKYGPHSRDDISTRIAADGYFVAVDAIVNCAHQRPGARCMRTIATITHGSQLHGHADTLRQLNDRLSRSR